MNLRLGIRRLQSPQKDESQIVIEDSKNQQD